MTTIDPTIIDLLDSGDIIQYRDAAGRGYSVKDIIAAKHAGNWEQVRRGLHRVFKDTPGVNNRLDTPDLTTRAINNMLLTKALNNHGIPYATNTSMAKVQPFFDPNDADKLMENYPGAITSPLFLETLFPPHLDPTVASHAVFPNGLLDIEAPNARPLSYSQNPRNLQANATIHANVRDTIHELRLRDPSDPAIPRLTKFLQEMGKIASTHFFGTGSVLGQLGRLQKGFEIQKKAQTMRAAQPTWSQINNCEALFKIWDKYRHIGPLQTQDPVNIDPMAFLAGPTVIINDPVDGQDITLGLLHVTMMADAGFPWENNETKLNSIPADIMLLKAMHDLLSGTGHEAPINVNEFAAKFDWSRFHKIKAKAEIYDIDKMHTKIRNISVPANVVMLLPQMLIKLVKWSTSTLKRPLNAKAYNGSLMSYAPFKGGHERLIDRIYSGEPLILYYADNLYIAEGGRYASMDVSSMEAVHDEVFFRCLLRYMMVKAVDAVFDEEGNLVDGGKLGHTNAWLIYEWFGRIGLNSPGVLRSFILQVPGMPSGIPGTFEINDALMAVGASLIDQVKPGTRLRSDGRPNLEVIHKLNSIGLTMKTETHWPGPAGANPTLHDARDEPWEPLQESPVIAMTDMLGYDTIYVKIGDNEPHAVAILNRERLMLALTFNKAEIRAEKVSENSMTLLQLATYNILYLQGGWAYDDIALALEATTTALMGQLNLLGAMLTIEDQQASATIISHALARAASTIGAESTIDEDMAKGLLRHMLGTGLVPLTSVFKIIHSVDLSNQLRSHIIANASTLSGKMVRMLGPIELGQIIADNPAQPWANELKPRVTLLLERLAPILREGPNTGSLPRDEGYEAPLPVEPAEDVQITKRQNPATTEDLNLLRDVNAFVVDELGPTAPEIDRLKRILEILELQYQGNDDRVVLIPPGDMEPDSPYAALDALATRLNMSVEPLLDALPDIERGLSIGYLAMDQEARPTKRRRNV